MYIYICIYVCRFSAERLHLWPTLSASREQAAANLRTEILDFGGLDLSMILILRVGKFPAPWGISRKV